ncbi:hypothetical protein EAF00_001286 [Botryotinia globosa]|nr:hypothetical protein EAF00_001286 [Botryotinia globosa]
MAERKLVIYDGQPEDLQIAVTKKVAASEATLKLEREMIRIRLRETKEMKNCAIESQVETKNQEIAECVA